MARITKASVAANQTTTLDRMTARASHAIGIMANNAESIMAIAPIGYQQARAKHDLAARVEAAKQYAATL